MKIRVEGKIIFQGFKWRQMDEAEDDSREISMSGSFDGIRGTQRRLGRFQVSPSD